MHEGRDRHGFGSGLVRSWVVKWLERLQCWSVLVLQGLIDPQWWLGWMLEDPLASFHVRLGEASTKGGVYVGSYGGEKRLFSFGLGVLDLLFDPGCLAGDVSVMLLEELRPYLLVVQLANNAFVPGSSRGVCVRTVGSRWRRSIFMVVWMTLHAPRDRWGIGL